MDESAQNGRRLEALETLARDFAASQAKQDAQMVAIGETLHSLGKDAREARDGVRSISGTLVEQKFGERLAELSAKISAATTEMRADMVNAWDKSKRETLSMIEAVNHEIEGLDDRLVILEDAKKADEGGNALIRGLKDWGAWALATAAGGVALIEHYRGGPH